MSRYNVFHVFYGTVYIVFHRWYLKHFKHLSINISLNPKHQGGDCLGAYHASIAPSEWYRQHSSHSSTDATDVRPARLECSRAEPSAAKPRKSELTGPLAENALRGKIQLKEQNSYRSLVCCTHHP